MSRHMEGREEIIDSQHGFNKANSCLTRLDRFRLDIRKNFLTERVVRHLTGHPEQLWMSHPWKCSRSGWTRL